MKDVREPEVIEPEIVNLAPYITTTITDNVEAAFIPPEKQPTTFCSTTNSTIGSLLQLRAFNVHMLLEKKLGDLQLVEVQASRSH